jgi:hypothetical protein
MLRWCHSIDELIEFLALVSTCAPDDLPQDDGDEPLDLERAFEEIHRGLDCSVDRIGDATKVEAFRSMINVAHELYRGGKINEGAWKLQDLERALEKV